MSTTGHLDITTGLPGDPAARPHAPRPEGPATHLTGATPQTTEIQRDDVSVAGSRASGRSNSSRISQQHLKELEEIERLELNMEEKKLKALREAEELKMRQQAELTAMRHEASLKLKREELELAQRRRDLEVRIDEEAENCSNISRRSTNSDRIRLPQIPDFDFQASTPAGNRALFDVKNESTIKVTKSYEDSRPGTTNKPENPAPHPREEPRRLSAPPMLETTSEPLLHSIREITETHAKQSQLLATMIESAMIQNNQTLEVLRDNQRRDMLPRCEIPKFSGENVTKYRPFVDAFDSCIHARAKDDKERLEYLDQHLTGKAKALIQGCRQETPSIGYAKAWRLLDETYGGKHELCNAYIRLIKSRPRIKQGDAEGILDYSVFLSECECALRRVNALAELEMMERMSVIVNKLPEQLALKWDYKSTIAVRDTGEPPSFVELVNFVALAAKTARITSMRTDPVDSTEKPSVVKTMKTFLTSSVTPTIPSDEAGETLNAPCVPKNTTSLSVVNL